MVRDLMTASRIESVVVGAGGSALRIDSPEALPQAASVDLLLVDWADREDGWASAIVGWRGGSGTPGRPRITLFGPHTDLAAHAAARGAGLGPMKARSTLFANLPHLLAAVR